MCGDVLKREKENSGLIKEHGRGPRECGCCSNTPINYAFYLGKNLTGRNSGVVREQFEEPNSGGGFPQGYRNHTTYFNYISIITSSVLLHHLYIYNSYDQKVRCEMRRFLIESHRGQTTWRKKRSAKLFVSKDEISKNRLGENDKWRHNK